ncbi:MAG: hypothetical protein E3J72_04515 [Planctomycetota bacterium]|nr:MAG: hypothetical protein E3J72_04515 [Planctomycetota bacterium]
MNSRRFLSVIFLGFTLVIISSLFGGERADAPRIPSSQELLRRFDKDGDGAITRAEWGAQPQMFQRLDTNRDGVLVADELKTLDRARRDRASGDRPAARTARRILVKRRQPVETAYTLENLSCEKVTITALVPKARRGVKVKSFAKGFNREVLAVKDGKVTVKLNADPVLVEEGDVPLAVRKEARPHTAGPFGFFRVLTFSREQMMQEGLNESEIINWIRKWKVPQVRYLGVTCERVHPMYMPSFAWDRVDPDFDGKELNFKLTDALVKLAQENRIQLLPCFSPHSNFHRDEKYLPDDSDAYKAYVSAVVERYDGDSENDMPGLKYKIERWQADNEPDLHNKIRPYYCLPQEYAKVLKLTHEAVKSADPNGIVVLASSCGEAQTDNRPVSRRYFAQCIKYGIGDHFDEISFHYYPVSYRISELAAYYDQIKNMFGKEYPFSITEICVSSKTKETMTFNRYAGANERTQAAFIARIHAWLCARPARHICWNTFNDLAPSRTRGRDVMMNRWAWGSFIEHETGNKKLSYFTYKLLSDKLGGVDPAKTKILSEEPGGIHAYRYSIGKKEKKIYIAWNEYFETKPTRKPGEPRDRKKLAASPFGITGGLAYPRREANKDGLSVSEGFLRIERERIALLDEVGAGWVRVRPDEFPANFAFGSILMQRGIMEVGWMDRIVMLAQSRNLSLCVVLAPPRNRRQVANLADNLPQWENYVRIIVERYDGDGEDDMPGLEHGVKHWEIDCDLAKSKNRYTTDQYVELLRSACGSAKKADKHAIVHLGSVGNIETLKELIKKGADQFYDIINLKYVSESPDLADFENLIADVREECPGTPLWMAEYGVNEKTQKDNEPTQAVLSPGERETKFFVQATVTGLVLGAEKMFWSPITDANRSKELKALGFFTSPDLKAKSAKYAVEKFTSLLEGCDLSKIEDASGEEETNFAYKFKDKDEKIRFIVGWCEPTSKKEKTYSVELWLPDGEYEILSAFPDGTGKFETKAATAKGGKLALPLTAMPVYVVPVKK